MWLAKIVQRELCCRKMARPEKSSRDRVGGKRGWYLFIGCQWFSSTCTAAAWNMLFFCLKYCIGMRKRFYCPNRINRDTDSNHVASLLHVQDALPPWKHKYYDYICGLVNVLRGTDERRCFEFCTTRYLSFKSRRSFKINPLRRVRFVQQLKISSQITAYRKRHVSEAHAHSYSELEK